MEKQVQMPSRMTIDKIVRCCKESKFFTVIVDSTTDISHRDQMAVLIRFATVNRLLKEAKIREHFIGYYYVTDVIAIGISVLLEEMLFHELGLNRKYVHTI